MDVDLILNQRRQKGFSLGQVGKHIRMGCGGLG